MQRAFIKNFVQRGSKLGFKFVRLTKTLLVRDVPGIAGNEGSQVLDRKVGIPEPVPGAAVVLNHLTTGSYIGGLRVFVGCYTRNLDKI